MRQAAAQTFDSLHGTVGFRALEDILPHLLAQLEEEGEAREYALDGLKQVMAIKSKVVLPYLVPQVCKNLYYCMKILYFLAPIKRLRKYRIVKDLNMIWIITCMFYF